MGAAVQGAPNMDAVGAMLGSIFKAMPDVSDSESEERRAVRGIHVE